jgi:hypothetical protein
MTRATGDIGPLLHVAIMATRGGYYEPARAIANRVGGQLEGQQP